MAAEDSNETDDLRKTIHAVNESRVIIGHTLSTVGFRGDPRQLVIDELQFVLRPAAVTFDHANESPRGNLIQEHSEFLRDQKANSGALKTQETFDSEDGSSAGPIQIHYKRFEFPPVQNAGFRTPLLKALIGIVAADEFRIQSWTITLYYNQHGDGGPQVRTDGQLSEAFRHHFASSVRHLSTFKASNNPPLEQWLPLIGSSPYLRLVLEELRDQILRHLEKVHLGVFGRILENPFTLQYFLRVGTGRSAGGPVVDEHLCYFPLKEEVNALEDSEDVLKSAISREFPGEKSPLGPERPVDFISRYPWEATRSLIGYTVKTGAARYFPDWTDEPILQEGDEKGSTRVDRRIATAIMQTMRAGTKHQFNIPLYASNELFGAIIVNTKEKILWDAQAFPVWCARQVGWVIDSALKMDPAVNDMARKIANAEARANQVRAYKHMLHSLVHHEGSYCETLDRLVAEIAGTPNVPETIRAWRPLLEYTSEDRKQLVSEFLHAPVDQLTGDPDSVMLVAAKDIYYDRGNTDLSIEDVENDLLVIERIFNSSDTIKINVSAGPVLHKRRTVPSLKLQVLRRIISNLFRNSLNCAKFLGKADAEAKFSLEVDAEQNPKRLTLIATDNCEGIQDSAFPFGKIGVQAWIDYLNELEKKPTKRESVRGMGFLTIARYAEATGGEFVAQNYRNQDGQVVGAKITVCLGLEQRKPDGGQ